MLSNDGEAHALHGTRTIRQQAEAARRSAAVREEAASASVSSTYRRFGEHVERCAAECASECAAQHAAGSAGTSLCSAQSSQDVQGSGSGSVSSDCPTAKLRAANARCIRAWRGDLQIQDRH